MNVCHPVTEAILQDHMYHLAYDTFLAITILWSTVTAYYISTGGLVLNDIPLTISYG